MKELEKLVSLETRVRAIEHGIEEAYQQHTCPGGGRDCGLCLLRQTMRRLLLEEGA
jgi:hypothetical protein